MEPLTALAIFAALLGSLCWEVQLTHQLSRRYYRLVCWLPARPARLPAMPAPGRPIRAEQLVIGVSSEGLQVRSTRKKHYVLLRVGADGRVRAGTNLWMWACLAAYLGVAAVMGLAALHQPPAPAALLLAANVAIVAGLCAGLRARTRAMIDAVERAVAAQVREERLAEIG